MKALPCQNRTCTGDRRQLGIKILGQAVIALPGGDPYLVARFSRYPASVKCWKCKRWSLFTALAFARLPELSHDQLHAFGMADALARDWVGDGLLLEQARDMMRAGFTLDEARALARG